MSVSEIVVRNILYLITFYITCYLQTIKSTQTNTSTHIQPKYLANVEYLRKLRTTTLINIL